MTWNFIKTIINDTETWNWYQCGNRLLKVPVSRHGLECLLLAEEIEFIPDKE